MPTLARPRSLALLLLLGLSGGCSSAPPEPPPEDPTAGRLRKIGLAYLDVHNTTGQPPQNVDQLKDALKRMGEGDPDALLVSPGDGKPFTILWRVDTRQGDAAPDSTAPPLVLAYEQVGTGGQRFVLTAQCFAVRLSPEEFAKARFPAGQAPR